MILQKHFHENLVEVWHPLVICSQNLDCPQLRLGILRRYFHETLDYVEVLLDHENLGFPVFMFSILQRCFHETLLRFSSSTYIIMKVWAVLCSGLHSILHRYIHETLLRFDPQLGHPKI